MNKLSIYSFVLILSFFSLKVFGQTNNQTQKCGFDAIHRAKLASDANYRDRTMQFDEMAAKYKFIEKTSQTAYKIPVVVHVMSDGTSLTSITDAEIRTAIKGLNERYRKVPGTLGSGNGVDIGIEFVLAVRDPNGNCTNGIVRYDLSSNATYVANGVMQSTSGIDDAVLKSYSVWDQTKYYNIWLISEIDNNNGGYGVQAYAYFATSHGQAEDGAVVMVSNFMNASSTTAAHEIGHALNLYHTFEGDDPNNNGTYVCPGNSNCSTNGDMVCDTPPHKRSASNCVAGTNSCDGNSSNDLFIHNYMDYSSDACQSEFTAGQKNRVIAALTTLRTSFLASNGNLSLVPPSAPGVDFISSTSGGCSGTKIKFFDNSSCIPNTFMDTTAWPNITFSWTFTNNNGVTITSTLQNPAITFNTAGTYDVTLTVTNAVGTNTVTRKGYIVITNALVAANCSPSYTMTSNLTYGIFKFNLNTLAHESQGTYDDNIGGLTVNGYGDFSCTQSTVLKPNTTYSLSVLGTSNSSLSENFKAFIDYNNDGDFVDAGEEIAFWNNITGGSGLQTKTFTTPASPTLNTMIRLRVMSSRNNETIVPCSPSSRGQTHDFGVFFTDKMASVTIAASPSSTVTYGTNVTFSASPVNGGTTPTYAWYVNGTLIAGQTGNTYSNSSLLNGDKVNCILNSNLTGVIASPSTSNMVTMVVTGAPLSDFIASDTLVCSGTLVSFTDRSLLTPTSWSWTATGAATPTSSVQNPSFTFNTPGTYTVTLVASNASGTGTTKTRTAYITVFATPGAQCTNFTRTNAVAGGIGITKVVLNNINKSTLNSDGVYQSFTCTDNTELRANTAYSLSIQVSSSNPQWVRAYIDYNNNNSFADAGELIYTNNSASGLVTTSITTPASPTLNTLLRMRVITDFNGAATASPCKTPLNYGQVEDYGVILRSACTSPAAPGTITGNATACSSSTGNVYSISAVSSATSYTWSVPAGATITAGQGTTSATVTFGATSGNVSVTAANTCGTSSAQIKAVTINSAPVTPGTISGNATICSNSTGNVYSITAVSGAASYTWTVPAGATITSGQGTTSATVTYGSISGNVSVTATNTCGTSSAQTLAVIISSTIATPGTISGNATACSSSTGNVYSITAVSGATNYTWSIPTGASITTGQGTTSATVTFGSTSGNVSVIASNSCATSSAQTIAVTINTAPSTPGSITGSATACSSSTGNVYSITAVSGATNYTWTVPAGSTITGGQGTTSATVTFGTTSGNVSVTATNTCGTTSASSTAVTFSSAPATPGTISGSSSACANSTGNVYSITAISGAASYTWTVPTGATITAGQGTISATVTFGSTSGNVSVTVTNTCGTSSAQSKAVTINTIPATPGTITGNATACSSSTGNVYSISAVSGAASYTWAVPAGASITAGQGTNSVTVTMGTSSGNVSVTATNTCGTSSAQTKAVTINTIPLTPSVSKIDSCGVSILSVTATTGTIKWSTNASTPVIRVTNPATYTVTQTVNSCISSVASIVATPFSFPTVTLQPLSAVCNSTPTFTLTGGSPVNGNYSGTGVTANQFNPSIAGSGSFPITYSYTDNNGCTSTAQQTISVGCNGIDDNSKTSFVVYPNPTSNILTFASEKPIDEVVIYDGLGKYISTMKNTLSQTEWKIDISNYSEGFYMIEMTLEGTKVRQTISKIK